MSLPPEALETARRTWMMSVFGRLADMALRARDGDIPSAEDMRRTMIDLLGEYPEPPVT